MTKPRSMKRFDQLLQAMVIQPVPFRKACKSSSPIKAGGHPRLGRI